MKLERSNNKSVVSCEARANGYVTDLTKLPGDRVRKGERLIEIENPEFITLQRNTIELRHLYTTARSHYLRQKTLAENNATTARQFEQSRGEYNVARSNYHGALIELESIGIQMDTLTEAPAYQRSIVIYSPVNGQISNVQTNMGQYIESHNELITITSEDHIHLELFVLEKDIDKVSLGQSVTFSSSTSHQTTFEAEVVKINSIADRNSGTVMVHCHILSDEVRFKGGTFAEALIQTESQEVSGLPRNAVVNLGGTWYGYILRNDSYQQVALSNTTDHGDFISFAPTPEQESATWVTGGAYYIQ